MKSSVVYTSEGRLNTKLPRQKELKSISHNFPESYRTNSTKEDLCLEYIKSFIDQFCALQPHRKVPYMIAENEVGVKKFVCTTLRPTLLPIPELYDLLECSTFIAGYILYEPLDPPYAPPKYLFSPSQTLDSHTGDSFDLAILLCSFLLGAGFDAYVVCGYAPKSITLKDQSKTRCPMINDTGGAVESNSPKSKGKGGSGPARSGSSLTGPESEPDHNDRVIDFGEHHSSYVAPDNSVKNSQYLADEAEKRRLAGLDTFRLWIPDPDVDEQKALQEDDDEVVMDPTTTARPMQSPSKKKGKGKGKPPAPQPLRRVHAWVLVRAGRRDVKEPVFVEPSTGRVYSLSVSPYLGVESVFNQVNFWVNSQVEEPVSKINFDLANNDKCWEQLFMTAEGEAGAAGDAGVGGEGAGGGDLDEAADLMDQQRRGQSNNDEDAARGGAPGGGKAGAGTGAGTSESRYFDAPPTWANPLALPRTRFMLRYPPQGRRSVQYHCAKADFFARRSQAQCMVMRITSYLDEACTVPRAVHEWFEGRPDRLFKRVRYFLDDRRFVEQYHPGSFGEVKRWTERPGKMVEVEFHVDGRLDRLARREEHIGQSVVEHFEGRTDHLSQRTVLLTADRHVVGTRQLPLPAGGSGSGAGGAGGGGAGGASSAELMAVKMIQLYEPDPASDGASIAKRVFHVADGKAVFYFHFGQSKITGEVKTYLHARGPTIPVMSDQALAQEEGVDDDQEALLAAGGLERDCYSSIKASFQQYQQLQEHRWEAELRIDYEKTVFERALDSADAAVGSSMGASGNLASDSVDAAETAGADYLAPFLRNMAGNGAAGVTAWFVVVLNKEDALEIRQACLDALKARLVERANIIQTKLHEENAALGKTQEQFQRAQREGEFDTQKYEDTCTKAMFRIQILEQRLAAHEEAALRKFADLDLKLSMDPRLKVLRN